jgi:hypothetical protein
MAVHSEARHHRQLDAFIREQVHADLALMG